MGPRALRADPAAPFAPSVAPVSRLLGRVAMLAAAAALSACAADGGGAPAAAVPASSPAAPLPAAPLPAAPLPAAPPAGAFPEAAPGAAAPPDAAVADWTTRFGVVAPGQGRKMNLDAFLAAQKGAGQGGPAPVPAPPAGSAPVAGPLSAAPAPVFSAPVDVRPTEEPGAAPLPALALADAPAAAAAAEKPGLADKLLAALGFGEATAENPSAGPALGVPILAENPVAVRAVEDQEAARRAAEGLSPGEAARRGRELLALGRAPQAERMFRVALVEEGPTEEIMVGLGSAWRQMGRRRQAETMLSRAVRNWPSSPSARNSHGAALYDLGAYAEAEAEFRVAADLMGRAGREIPLELSRNIAMAARARGAEPAPIAPPAPLGVVAAAARQSGSAAPARIPAADPPAPATPAPAPPAPSVVHATPAVVMPPPALAAMPSPEAGPALSAPPPARPAAPRAAPST